MQNVSVKIVTDAGRTIPVHVSLVREPKPELELSYLSRSEYRATGPVRGSQGAGANNDANRDG